MRSPSPSGYWGATRRTSHSGKAMATAMAAAATASRRRVARVISVSPAVAVTGGAIRHGGHTGLADQWHRAAAGTHPHIALHLLMQRTAEVGAVEREHAGLEREPGQG